MKWYNYKHYWIDITKCYTILLIEHQIRFIFYGNGDDYIEVNYKKCNRTRRRVCKDQKANGNRPMNIFEYKHLLINKDQINYIEKDPADGEYPSFCIVFTNGQALFNYGTNEERDAELSKIKLLMGIENG
jgi:hypothetical protein